MTVIARVNRRKPHLNLTPLIDVIFLLIVFFMLTSRFSLDSVIDAEVASSTAKSVKQTKTKNTVLIILDKDNKFKIWSEDGAGSKDFFSLGMLRSSITPLLVRDKNRELIIVVDDAITVQQSIQALEAAKIAGAKNVRLAEGAK